MRSNRRGFTLIELLVVVSIIGLLASIALPRYSVLKQRAHVAAMISDLRNLLTAQEAFLSAHGDYAGTVTGGPEVPGTGGAGRVSLQLSPGVQLEMHYRSNPSTGEGWNAIASHPGVTDDATDECGIFVGPPAYAPAAEVTVPGAIVCF
jgi:prepilin-type N-terminal cleavage/methylation domain-containing protein